MDIMTALKEVVNNYMHNESPADVVHATYTGTGLKIDNLPFEISADIVDVPLSLQTVSATLSGTFEGVNLSVEGATVTKIALTNAPVTITRGLVAGDRVTVVSQHGGQRYSIIDRTGE